MVRGIEIKKLYKEGNGMRKLLSVLLIAMLGLSMFTACNPGSSASEDLVSVKLMEGQSRALTATLDFDISTQVKRWEYSAIKADKGLTTGQTGTSESKTTKVLGTNNETELLSQGYWNFDLYGYDAESNGNMICKGSVENVLVTLENNSVTILVAPKQETTGTIVISSDISILFNNGTTFSDANGVYTKVVEVSNATSGFVIKSETELDSDIRIESASSNITYKVVVSFIGDYGKSTRYTAAKATKYINVYDNLTTTVNGSITESGTQTIINAVTGSDSSSAEATIASSLFANNSGDNTKKTNSDPITIVAASGLSTSSDGGSVSVTENVITLPAGAVVKSSTATDNDGATFTMKSENLLSQASGSNTTTASEEKLAKYTISGLDGAPVATLEFGLNGASLDESLSKSNSDKAPTGYIYIAPNQGASFDVENGSDDVNSAVKKTPTLNIGYLDGSGSVTTEDDGQKPELLKYVKETGYLEYRVYHFSTYVIFSNKYVASDSYGNLYETLGDAAENVSEGAKITLWKNLDMSNTGGSDMQTFLKSGYLDLGKSSICYGGLNCGSFSVADPVTNLIIDGEAPEGAYNISAKCRIEATGAIFMYGAITAWKPTVTVKGGRYTGTNAVVYVQCQGEYDVPTVIVNGGEFVATGKGSSIALFIGKAVINGGNFSAEEGGDIFYLDGSFRKKTFEVVVNEGNFEAAEKLITWNKYDYPCTIEIKGGTYTCNTLVEVVGTQNEGIAAKDYIKISGGTFSVDPSEYVIKGYKAVKNTNGQSDSWTVVADE